MLLLHAFPQAHAIWHRISPALAASGRTVVATDLRGSGDSSRPVAWEDHSGYSFRSMAADQVETGPGRIRGRAIPRRGRRGDSSMRSAGS